MHNVFLFRKYVLSCPTQPRAHPRDSKTNANEGTRIPHTLEDTCLSMVGHLAGVAIRMEQHYY